MSEEQQENVDALDSAIDSAQSDVNVERGTSDNDNKKQNEEEKPKFAWGNEERRKAYSGEERRGTNKDPELDIGEMDDKGQSKKYKLSEIKERAKWIRENTPLINAAVSMRKEFTDNPELSKAFTTFWGKAFENNKYNPEFVGKMGQFLEGKQEQIESKIDEKTDDIKEMETLLTELDSDSPQAKILKSNIANLKALRVQLSQTLESNKAMQAKIDGIEKFKTGFEKNQADGLRQRDEQAASELFDKEFKTLTAKEKTDGYFIEDSEDLSELERLVRESVASEAGSKDSKITNDDAFLESIRRNAKAAFEKISKRKEKYVNDYLKKKGLVPKEAIKPKERQPEKERQSNVSDAIDKLVDEAGDQVLAKR